MYGRVLFKNTAHEIGETTNFIKEIHRNANESNILYLVEILNASVIYSLIQEFPI